MQRLRGRRGCDRIFPAREGIPMQSSLWKLLTAAGIIGIGTLVVLEVQSRLPASGSQSAGLPALAQGTGADISVTPDDTTELDHLLAAAGGTAGIEDTASFDSVGGTGTPAPPAEDSRFFAANAVSRTVHKDDLTDGASPFAMEEPPFESAVTKTQVPEADPAFFGPSTTPPESAQPASFVSDAGDDSSSLPTLSLPAANDDSETPFPAEESAAAVSPTISPTTPPTEKHDHGTASSLPAAVNPARTGASADTTFFNAGGSSRKSAAPAITAPAAATVTSESKPSSGIERTAMSQDSADHPPTMFLPEPVPDVTRPAVRVPADPITPESKAPDFDGGSARQRPAPDMDSGRRLAPESDTDETVPVFGIEPPVASPVRRDGASELETEPKPFTEDSQKTTPATPRAVPAADFPESIQPGPASDLPNDRADTDSTEPFGGPDDGLPDSAEPRPLPTADDQPPRTDRPDSGSRSDVVASARTVSEVMRPQLTIQKRAPDTATVGVSHDYTIVVTNEGDSPAYDVVVEDELGTAADIVDAKPVADFDRTAGLLSWALPELKPQERKEIVVRITPTGEGTLDGVATVRFKAQVKSATVITSPKLQIDVTAPKEVKVGDEVQLQYVIRNSGTGDASNVILRSVLPPGLKHPEGGDLEYEIELLQAGDQETIDLTVVAAEPGEQIRVTTEVTASGVSADQSTTDIAIVGAQLSIERLGPERRFVGRSATYQNIVTNETNFEAANAIVVEQIPEGMRFLSASHDGEYNPESRQVRWAIDRLLPGKQAVLEIELKAETAGQMETTVEVSENAGFRSRADENTVVTVEDLHNVTADISRQDEPVAIGERFGFTITIDNRGTAVARNVQMSVQVPPEIKVLAAGTREVAGKLMSGNLVKYDSVLTIQPDTNMTFQLTLQGQQGVRNALVQAYLKYDEMQEPLIVSESVTVYDDQP